MEPKTFLFFGSPGAGKSTQAELFAENFKKKTDEKVLSVLWSHIRDEFMQGNSSVQKRIQENHAAGKLQPKFFSISIWGPLFLRQLHGDEHLIIDGIPRQAFEAEALDSAFDHFDRSSVVVLNMVIKKGKAFERIHSRAIGERRIDDADKSIIHKRLAWFETNTLPILETYRQNPRYKVIDIDAEQDEIKIQESLQKILLKELENHGN